MCMNLYVSRGVRNLSSLQGDVSLRRIDRIIISSALENHAGHAPTAPDTMSDRSVTAKQM